MISKKINKKDIRKLLGTWSQEFSVIVPTGEQGIAEMAGWDNQDISFLDWYRNTVVPPKACFLPQSEVMISFQKNEDGFKMEVPRDEHKQIIFGIRPCDARAIAILDQVFADTYDDYYYASKRRNTLLVGLSCTNPYDSCFCTSSDVNPAESQDVDLMFTDIGDEYVIEELTSGGKALLNTSNMINKATKADINKAKEVRAASVVKLKKKVDTKDVDRKLRSCFNDIDYWEQVAAKCISCGICTFLCPTCFCFDINDEMIKKHGARYRGWDSCSFRSYTKMPMENPREEKWRRVRQRVCHKFEFYPMNLGINACTGCGRCIRLCPVNWDITQVIAGLPGEISAHSGK